MIGYPLDSHVEYDEYGTPSYDRAITSAPLRKLYNKLFTDGVMPNPSTNMQVVPGSGMNVVVKPGFAICAGCLKLEETPRVLAVQASSNMYDRIDTVVLRLNDNDNVRSCDFYIKEGAPATAPVRPSLTRDASVWEIGLADLFISKNTGAISVARITDTRYESGRCGVISSISEFDTTTIYNQVQSDLAGFKAEEQAEFIDWFNNIQAVLDKDVAGHLQNEIDDLDTRVSTNESDISSLAENTSKSIEEIISELGGTVLWTNTNSNNDFAAQTITVNNLSDYKYVVVKFKGHKMYADLGGFNVKSEIPRTGGSVISSVSWPNVDNAVRAFWVREYTVMQNQIVFRNSNQWSLGASTSTEKNERMIPISIIGTNVL